MIPFVVGCPLASTITSPKPTHSLKPGCPLGTLPTGSVLATDVVRQDRHESSGPAVVDVKPAEHARDLDRLGRVDVHDGLRRHTLPDPLVGPVLVEVQLVPADTAHEPLGTRGRGSG